MTLLTVTLSGSVDEPGGDVGIFCMFGLGQDIGPTIGYLESFDPVGPEIYCDMDVYGCLWMFVFK
jgi:hypothetical protein